MYSKIKHFDYNFLCSLFLSDFSLSFDLQGFLPVRFYVRKFVNVFRQHTFTHR